MNNESRSHLRPTPVMSQKVGAPWASESPDFAYRCGRPRPWFTCTNYALMERDSSSRQERTSVNRIGKGLIVYPYDSDSPDHQIERD